MNGGGGGGREWQGMSDAKKLRGGGGLGLSQACQQSKGSSSKQQCRAGCNSLLVEKNTDFVCEMELQPVGIVA